MKLRTKLIVWPLQLICAAILFGAAWAKLSSQPLDIILFTDLGMEPTGRYVVGIVELLSAIFLLTNRLAATGAFLAIGTMCGAIIAHASILGYNVMGDNGRHILMLIVVFVSSLIVAVIRKKDLPFIGNAFRQ